jgi:hypothetical protein
MVILINKTIKKTTDRSVDKITKNYFSNDARYDEMEV